MSSAGSFLYDENFYAKQRDGSFRSAQIYVKELQRFFEGNSIVDLGCGVGTWLTAFGAMGCSRLVGYDGSWNSQDKMINPSIEFRATDLNLTINQTEKFDLAISLEVAEHCRPESSQNFVDSLTNLSDAILFGAAFTGQPGTDHINTRPHSYWASKFVSKNYAMFDLFRSKFWGNDQIDPWYCQNTFLYVRPNHKLFFRLIDNNIRPIENLMHADCIHPWLFNHYFYKAKELQKQIDSLRSPS